MNNHLKRELKAAFMRELRNAGIGRKMVKNLATRQFGEPDKETLGDYWPIQRIHDGGLSASSFDENGESWCHKWLLPGVWDDDEIAYVFNISGYYGGPGRSFGDNPIVERSEYSTLVTQTGGLDI